MSLCKVIRQERAAEKRKTVGTFLKKKDDRWHCISVDGESLFENVCYRPAAVDSTPVLSARTVSPLRCSVQEAKAQVYFCSCTNRSERRGKGRKRCGGHDSADLCYSKRQKDACHGGCLLSLHPTLLVFVVFQCLNSFPLELPLSLHWERVKFEKEQLDCRVSTPRRSRAQLWQRQNQTNCNQRVPVLCDVVRA